jgi:hypothetical protein
MGIVFYTLNCHVSKPLSPSYFTILRHYATSGKVAGSIPDGYWIFQFT